MLWIAIGVATFVGSLVIALACCKVSGDYSRYDDGNGRPSIILIHTKAERRYG